MNNTILKVDNLSVYFNKNKCIENISLEIKKGKIYSVIGPNGCGKTTLIRAISRSLKPDQGTISLYEKNIYKLRPKQVAQRMATLYQTNETISDITVKELINYGRYAHRKWWQSHSEEDKKIVDWAISTTGLEKFKDRKVMTLSGGERQRAWIAMSMAQKPEIFILDEPTTYLDISHQLEVLELIKKLNREENITVVMVLHDINQAAKYSDQMIVIKDHHIYQKGQPSEILNPSLLKEVFNVEADIVRDPESDRLLFFPKRSLGEGAS